MMRNTPSDFDPDSAIIDAELLLKYRMLSRAIDTLERAIDSAPRHIGLREKLREILIDSGRRDQAAQRCLELASLYIQAGDMESANARLLEAKRLDPRVSVTGQLRDVGHKKEEAAPVRGQQVLRGSIGDISLFDIMQILENSRLTGLLRIESPAVAGEVHFNEGQIVNARMGDEAGLEPLGQLIEASEGSFEFEKTSTRFELAIQATSNTALILDLLRAKDEAEHGITPDSDNFPF